MFVSGSRVLPLDPSGAKTRRPVEVPFVLQEGFCWGDIVTGAVPDDVLNKK